MDATQTGADTDAQFQSLIDNGLFNDPGQTQDEAIEENQKPEAAVEENQTSSDEVQLETAETAPEADEGENQENWENLDHFLKTNELDPETFRQIPVTVKIDGKEQNVPLSDVIKSYQLEGHVNNKSIELSNERKAFEAEQEAARTLISQQLQQNQALGELAMQQLTSEFQSIDWNSLRQSDPGQYAALVTDYNNRYSQIQNHLAQVQQQQQQVTQEQQKTQLQNLQKERELMLQAKPEWSNQETFAKDTGEMTQYAKKLGYTDAEIGSISDHRWMQVLHDAARYAALQAKTPAATKRVREAPKMQAKPGTRQNRDPKQVARQQVIERYNQNPRDPDAMAAMFELYA